MRPIDDKDAVLLEWHSPYIPCQHHAVVVSLAVARWYLARHPQLRITCIDPVLQPQAGQIAISVI